MPWVEDNDKLGERFALPGGGRFTHHLYHHVTSKGESVGTGSTGPFHLLKE